MATSEKAPIQMVDATVCSDYTKAYIMESSRHEGDIC